MNQTTSNAAAKFAALREAARAKAAAQQAQIQTLEEAIGDDATFTAPQTVESFIAALGLEGTK
jgi:hypothetical protein